MKKVFKIQKDVLLTVENEKIILIRDNQFLLVQKEREWKHPFNLYSCLETDEMVSLPHWAIKEINPNTLRAKQKKIFLKYCLNNS